MLNREEPESKESEQYTLGLTFKNLVESPAWKKILKKRDEMKEAMIDELSLKKVGELGLDDIPRSYYVRGQINGLEMIPAYVESILKIWGKIEERRKRRKDEALGKGEI